MALDWLKKQKKDNLILIIIVMFFGGDKVKEYIFPDKSPKQTQEHVSSVSKEVTNHIDNSIKNQNAIYMLALKRINNKLDSIQVIQENHTFDFYKIKNTIKNNTRLIKSIYNNEFSLNENIQDEKEI